MIHNLFALNNVNKLSFISEKDAPNLTRTNKVIESIKKIHILIVIPISPMILFHF
jgi:hypothetical protein